MDQVVVDGNSEDWAEFFFATTTIDDPATRRADEVSVALAPGGDELLFCLRVADESRANWTAWRTVTLEVEFSPTGEDSLQFDISRNATRAWKWYRDSSSRLHLPEGAVGAIWGACLEGRLNLAALVQDSGNGLSRDWIDTEARPWLRVSATLWPVGLSQQPLKEAGRVPQLGPCVASYRLCPERFAPPWARPIPASAPAARAPAFLEGKWFISNGPDCWPTHVGIPAYDFSVSDSRGAAWRGQSSSRKEDYRAWGAAIGAPTDGVIEITVGEHQDGEPSDMTGSEFRRRDPVPDNFVVGRGAFIWRFGHLRQGSVSVGPGESVTRGQRVAAVGSSGGSSGPHLHLQVNGLDYRTGLPLVLEQVAIGLNSDPADPWEVRLSEWKVEGGYFVRGLPSADTQAQR